MILLDDELSQRVLEELETSTGRKIECIQDVTENDINPLRFLQCANLLKQMRSLRSIQFSYPRLGEMSNPNYTAATTGSSAADGATAAADLSNLAFVPNLQTLTLSGCKLTTARFLSTLPRLERAYLNNNLIYDLGDFAADCSTNRVTLNLTRLDLSNNTLPDRKALALDRLAKALPNLRSLNLTGCPLLTSNSAAPAITDIGLYVQRYCPNIQTFCERSFHATTRAPPAIEAEQRAPSPPEQAKSRNTLSPSADLPKPRTPPDPVKSYPSAPPSGSAASRPPLPGPSSVTPTRPAAAAPTTSAMPPRTAPSRGEPPLTHHTSTPPHSGLWARDPQTLSAADAPSLPSTPPPSTPSPSATHFFSFNPPETRPSVSTLPDAPSLVAYTRKASTQKPPPTQSFFNTPQTPQIDDFQPVVPLESLRSTEDSPAPSAIQEHHRHTSGGPIKSLWPSASNSGRSSPREPMDRHSHHQDTFEEEMHVDEYPSRKTTDIREELARHTDSRDRSSGAFQSLVSRVDSPPLRPSLTSSAPAFHRDPGLRDRDREMLDSAPHVGVDHTKVRSVEDESRRRLESVQLPPRPRAAAPGTADLSHLRTELEKWKEESLKPYRDVMPSGPAQQRQSTISLIMENRGARIPPSTSSGAGILQTPQTPVMFGTTMDLNTTPPSRKPFDSGGSPTSVSTASTSVGFPRRPTTTDSFPDLVRPRTSTFDHRGSEARQPYDASGEPSHRSPGTLRNLRLPDTTDETRFHPRR